jgi:hypothetical protein
LKPAPVIRLNDLGSDCPGTRTLLGRFRLSPISLEVDSAAAVAQRMVSYRDDSRYGRYVDGAVGIGSLVMIQPY